MTLESLVYATEYDVYIRSMWATDTPKPELNQYVSDLLRGCSGIMNLEVQKIEISPEDLAIYALVDLPEEVLKAIYKYNTKKVY